MVLNLLINWKTVLLGLLATAVSVVGVALLVAYSGIYSVAASAGHPLWLDWFLALGMRRSVQFNARAVTAPPLQNETLVPLGAAHFDSGCAVCHGSPGQTLNPVFAHMLPMPPALQHKVSRWQTNELFWIVKHGLQYAGMPGWSGELRDDEVWSVVAFLERLDGMAPHTYGELVMGNAQTINLPRPANDPDKVSWLIDSQCDRCHETEDAPPTSTFVPYLAGQKRDYLFRSLMEYQTNLRGSGIMEPQVNRLTQKDMLELAEYYATLEGSRGDSQPVPQALLDRGSAIAHEGVAPKKIPACLSCHGANGRAQYPSLDGQHANFIASQLRLWRAGGRVRSDYGKLMASVATKMTDAEIDAVAAWFAQQSPAEEARP